MPRYRNDGSMPLNYSDSGGPWVAPGETFEHTIPPAQLASHLAAGFLTEIHSAVIGEGHVHATREVFDKLASVPGQRRRLLDT
jgi:hypothetical protein